MLKLAYPRRRSSAVDSRIRFGASALRAEGLL